MCKIPLFCAHESGEAVEALVAGLGGCVVVLDVGRLVTTYGELKPDDRPKIENLQSVNRFCKANMEKCHVYETYWKNKSAEEKQIEYNDLKDGGIAYDQ